MRFLRMLTNSLLAGALGAAFLTIVVLQLNPSVPLRVGDAVAAGSSRSALFYGVHLAVVFYLLIVAREFFGIDALSPGWVSVRVLAWLGAALVGRRRRSLMWLNVSRASRRRSARARPAA